MLKPQRVLIPRYKIQHSGHFHDVATAERRKRLGVNKHCARSLGLRVDLCKMVTKKGNCCPRRESNPYPICSQSVLCGVFHHVKLTYDFIIQSFP